MQGVNIIPEIPEDKDKDKNKNEILNKITESIQNEKERLQQVALALEERLHFLLNTDARYQYLQATKTEIQNQLTNLENISKFKEVQE